MLIKKIDQTVIEINIHSFSLSMNHINHSPTRPKQAIGLVSSQASIEYLLISNFKSSNTISLSLIPMKVEVSWEYGVDV